MSGIGSITALVQRLKASGATPEMLADVLETFAATIDLARNSTGIPVDQAAEKRRAYDRDRKAAAKARSTGNSTGIPPEKRNSPSSPPDGPPPSPAPLPPPLNPPTPSVTTARGCTLPADWRPTAKHFEFAASKSRSAIWVHDQAIQMREWAGANRNRAVARKADWDLTFTGWMRRALNKPGGSNRGPPRRSFSDIADDADRELFGEPDGPRPRQHDRYDGPTLDLVAGGS